MNPPILPTAPQGDGTDAPLLKIEKGIPVPERRTGKKIHHPFNAIPWKDLEIGDSVRVEHTSCGGLHKRAAVHGMRIIIRGENPQGKARAFKAFRLWRIA